jgi:hypothetical protein
LLGAIAKALGLTNGADFHCQGTMWSNPQGLRIVFCNIPGRSEQIVVRTDQKFGIYWLVKDGNLSKTVYHGYDAKGQVMIKIVPNDFYQDGYQNVVKYFFDKANEGKK